MWPTRQQWKNWSLPSKLTAIGTLIGLISFVLTIATMAPQFGHDEAKMNKKASVIANEPVLVPKATIDRQNKGRKEPKDTAKVISIFKPFLNGKSITNDSEIVIPMVANVAVLQFSIQNIGSVPTSDLMVCITYPNSFTNVVLDGWQKLPPPDAFEKDQILSQAEFAHYEIAWRSPVANGNGVSLPEIRVSNPSGAPFPLSLNVWSSTTTKSVTRLRLRFIKGVE